MACGVVERCPTPAVLGRVVGAELIHKHYAHRERTLRRSEVDSRSLVVVSTIDVQALLAHKEVQPHYVSLGGCVAELRRWVKLAPVLSNAAHAVYLHPQAEGRLDLKRRPLPYLLVAKFD
jgi:hypothetical protein